MFEKIGKRAIVAPLGIALILCCVFGVALAPMMRAEPTEVPFIVVNEDEGAVTVMGNNNVGETLVDNLLSGEGEFLGEDSSDEGDDTNPLGSATITWTQFDSEDAALEALKGTDYYGALVIPRNFTSQQMNALVGLSNSPELKMYLNEGKNAQMASTMQTMLTANMMAAGISLDAELVNTADVGGGTMAPTMMIQMIVMPFMVMCLICAIFLSLLVWKKDLLGLREKSEMRALGVQVLIAAVFSAVLAVFALLIEVVGGGLTLPFGELFLFLWAAGFCVVCLFMGFCNLMFPLGVLIAVSVFALGMGTGMLGQEMLPAFWADFIYPWVPQARIGNGIRDIVYFHTNPYGTEFVALLITGFIGLVALALAPLASKASKRKGQGNGTAQE